MMNMFKEWIMHIISAMLLISLVQHLMPEGSLQKVSSLISGLVLLVVMLQPIPKIKEIDWDLKVKQYQQEFEEKRGEFEDISKGTLSEEIEKQTAEVIEQRAELYGESVKASVETRVNEQGIPMPTVVSIQGTYQESLSCWIESALGIPANKQTWLFEKLDEPP